jgi:protein-S-isoprenylcysteine O-methyltransferase Ste14
LLAVKELSLKVSETHRPEKLVTSGVYNIIRHPQYLAGILGHIGISMLNKALHSVMVTPIVFGVIYIIAWKEEKELINEFGLEYENYKKNVPMFLPISMFGRYILSRLRIIKKFD